MLAFIMMINENLRTEMAASKLLIGRFFSDFNKLVRGALNELAY